MSAPAITKLEQPYSDGGLYKSLYGYMNGPTAYETGGVTLTAKDFSLTAIQFLVILCMTGDRIAHPVFATNDAQEYSIKLLITDNAGTEIGNGVDISAKKFRFKVTGSY